MIFYLGCYCVKLERESKKQRRKGGKKTSCWSINCSCWLASTCFSKKKILNSALELLILCENHLIVYVVDSLHLTARSSSYYCATQSTEVGFHNISFSSSFVYLSIYLFSRYLLYKNHLFILYLQCQHHPTINLLIF
jgi:hypothetical protein